MSATTRAFAAVLAAVPLAARASPAVLTAAEVRELVTRPDCGGIDASTPEGAALRERMVAKFRQESGVRGTDLVHPFAIRDETLGAAVTPTPATYEAAVGEAMWRIGRGHVLGLGLGQVTGLKNLLADFGVASVADAVRLAFTPCPAVRATMRHYAADVRLAMRVLDCASAAYNAGPGQICQDTAYVRSVRALQAALPADLARAPPIGRPAVIPPPALRLAPSGVSSAFRPGHSPRMPEKAPGEMPMPAATVEVLLPLPAAAPATNPEAP